MRLTWLGTFTLICAGCPGDDDRGVNGSMGTSGSATDDPSETLTSGQTSGTSTGTDPSTGTESSTSGSTSTSSATSSTGTAGFCDDEPIPGLESAVAMLYGDLPPLGGGTTTTTSAGGPDDDELWVRIGNIALTCEMPRGDTSCEEGVEKWWITMRIPVELQTPGEYDFDELNVYIGSDEGVDCQVGGTSTSTGGGPSGIVYIDAIGSEGITGCIVSGDVTELDANGSFSAPNCSR